MIPSSGSITSPVPEMIRECSRSATASRASRRRNARSIRQSLASSTAARDRFPLNSSSFASNFANKAKASAAAPANPPMTLSLDIRRTLRAVCFITISPKDTCPSPAMATWPRCRTDRIVVPRVTRVRPSGGSSGRFGSSPLRLGIMNNLNQPRAAFGSIPHPGGGPPAAPPRPRMGAIVHLQHLVQADVGVPLRGAEERVAQEFLDGAKVRARVQQMGGKAVPQAMGGELLLQAALPQQHPG